MISTNDCESMLKKFGANIGRKCPDEFRKDWLTALRNLDFENVKNTFSYFEPMCAGAEFREWPPLYEFHERYKIECAPKKKGCRWCHGEWALIELLDKGVSAGPGVMPEGQGIAVPCRKCTGHGVDTEYDKAWDGRLIYVPECNVTLYPRNLR